MKAHDKIMLHRKAFINQYGYEPNGVILGYEILSEAKRELPCVYKDGKMEIYGMQIVRDNNKPTEVKVGDYTIW